MSLLILERSMERDNFMSPSQAKEFGIIDKVLAHPLQEEEENPSVTTLSEETVNATIST